MRRIAPYMGPVGFVLKHPELFGGLIMFALPRISDTAGAMLRTTLAFTMAKGSGGINVIPDEAYVIGNMRTAFHQDIHASIAAIKALSPIERASSTSFAFGKGCRPLTPDPDQ